MYIGKQQRQKLGFLPDTWEQLFIITDLHVGRDFQNLPTQPRTPPMTEGRLRGEMTYGLGGDLRQRRDSQGGASPCLLLHVDWERREKKVTWVWAYFLLRLEENESLGLFFFFFLKQWFRVNRVNCTEYEKYRETEFWGWLYIGAVFQVCIGTGPFGSACVQLFLILRSPQPRSAG